MAALNSTMHVAPMPKGIEEYKRYRSINDGEWVAETANEVDYTLVENNGWVQRGEIRVYSFSAPVTISAPVVAGDLVAYQWRPAGLSSGYGEGFYVTSDTYLAGTDVAVGQQINIIPVEHNIDAYSVWLKIGDGDYSEIGEYPTGDAKLWIFDPDTETRRYTVDYLFKIAAPLVVGDVFTIQLRPAGYESDIGSEYYITSDEIEVTAASLAKAILQGYSFGFTNSF